MKNWDIEFISYEDFKIHVTKTIEVYKETLKSINLAKFNSNIIDPIKLIFDSKVYRKELEKVIEEEITRQRAKTNNNATGYFPQRLFSYIKNCEVPQVGFALTEK